MGSNRTDFQGRRSSGSRFCMLLVFLCGMAVSTAFAQQEATNVVFIMTDDQGIWSLGCYGNPEIRTPNLDRLAAAGARFTRAFATSPVCSPSRATFLTGRIPSQHGIHEWIREENMGPQAASLIEKEETFSEILAQNGYTLGITGKWHLGDSLRPQKGFTFWSVMPRGSGRYNNAPLIRNGKVEEVPGYITQVITDRALEFVNENWRRPFFLWVNYSAPHGPWSGHPERLVDLYRNIPFNSIPKEDLHPWAIQNAARHIGNKESLAQYFASVTGIDEGVGRIVSMINRVGITDRTLIIFVSDQGFMVGHHGLWGKGNASQPKNMYDLSFQIPLIFSHPGKIAPGQVIDQMVNGYDFFPTLLDYLGIRHRGRNLPGRSYAPFLRGELIPWENVVYGEYGLARMVRTEDWKYVARYPNGPNELYDVRKDPGERENLAGQPHMRGTFEGFHEQLETWFKRFVDPTKDPVRLSRDPTILYRRERPFSYPELLKEE